jgi:predicted TPR repeat methyltransferase
MGLTIEQALQRAIEDHKAGKLQDAEALYKFILQTQPKHPDANHNLGVIAAFLNNTEAALPLFKNAVEADPSQGQFWLSYVFALINEKQFDNARNVLEEGKKRGLSGEKVDFLEAQLVQNDIYLMSQKTHTNKLSIPIDFLETGRYQEARDWLTKFLEVEPTDAEGWSLMSQLFLLDNKDAQAEKAIETAILINPNLPSIYRNQARLLLKQSKPAEALVKAQSGLEKSTEDPESLIILAACLISNQRDLEATPLIEKALKARPNYAEAFANKGLVRLRAKNISGAIEDFEKAGALKPHLTQIWERLGALHYQNRNLSGAIEALKKAQALEPDNVNRMINLGEFLRQDQKIEEAIAILEEAAVKAPENAYAWINLGTALQQHNKIDKAKVSYKKALAINPNSTEVYNNLGSIAKDNKDWDSALKYFEQAITIRSDYVEAHINLGNTLQELGRLEDAETSYNKAISIKPGVAQVHHNLGITLQKLGRLKDAETSFNRAIAIKQDYAEAHSNLGNTLQELGRLEDAVQSYDRAISIKPGMAQVHYNLGITLQKLGRLEDALQSYGRTISIKPGMAQVHYNLGITLKELGRLEDAEISFKRAIAIKPDYAEAHSNLGNTLQELGRLEDAKTSFNRAIANKPDYAEKLSHQIASISGLNPARATDAYVSGLFDVYANKFESSLVGELKYNIPTIIADLLQPFVSSINPTLDILDLGCGTGLSGEALTNLAKNLVGIDLSKEMLKIAKAKNIYHRLIQDEIHHALSHERRASFDIVVSSDVFVYIGDIKAIFDQVYDVLKMGGFFAYSTEALYLAENGKEKKLPNYKLNSNGRYSHSSKYLLDLIDADQFILHNLEEVQIRLEKGRPVMGYVVIMQKQT